MDDTTVWIIVIAAIVVVAAALAVWLLSRKSQSRQLKRRFGPEYDRTVERNRGDRQQAEEVLAHRVTRREQLELRPLSPSARETYRRRWAELQAEFVDRPAAAVEGAQTLLDEVMAERGYPVGDEFDERADLVSVDHPVVAENYRDAHRLHRETRDADDTPAATEKRRQSLVHYRALFADLLDSTGDGAEGTAERDTVEVPDDVQRDRGGARRIR
ncbi:MAG TPA: hypothetical protein VFZ77_11860 [Acidimicrobiales bacterium]